MPNLRDAHQPPLECSLMTRKLDVSIYKRLLCRRSANGTSGVMMVSQAFGTSTSTICLRVIFLVKVDLAPNVATSLFEEPIIPRKTPGPRSETHHTVATPYLRCVRTSRCFSCFHPESSRRARVTRTFMTVEHVDKKYKNASA